MVLAGLTVIQGGLLAQRLSPFDPRLLWAVLGLAGAVLVGALVIVYLDRWRKNLGEEKPSANDQLAEFRSLYDRGEMSQEEFERVKARLTERLRQEMDVPAAPPAAPEPPKTTPPEPPPGGPAPGPG